jgi:hypothetical protein
VNVDIIDIFFFKPEIFKAFCIAKKAPCPFSEEAVWWWASLAFPYPER